MTDAPGKIPRAALTVLDQVRSGWRVVNPQRDFTEFVFMGFAVVGTEEKLPAGEGDADLGAGATAVTTISRIEVRGLKGLGAHTSSCFGATFATVIFQAQTACRGGHGHLLHGTRNRGQGAAQFRGTDYAGGERG